MPKIFKYLPKWWNFAQSGHTGQYYFVNVFSGSSVANIF